MATYEAHIRWSNTSTSIILVRDTRQELDRLVRLTLEADDRTAETVRYLYKADQGDLVWGRPWSGGQQARQRRKGLVLKDHDADTGTTIVWWFNLGDPAAGPTVQAMYPRELERAGSYHSATIRQLRFWERALYRTNYAPNLGYQLSRLRIRLKAAAH